MIYQVLSDLKVTTKQGEATLGHGQIIDLKTSLADLLLAQGKIKPASKDFREETLDAILFTARDEITAMGKPYRQTDALVSIEDEMGHLYREVLDGRGSITDFRDACERWVSISQQAFSQTKKD